MKTFTMPIFRRVRSMRFSPTVLMAVALFPLIAAAHGLQTLENARYIEYPRNHGNSFMVEAGGKQYIVRLYFIDCPKTEAQNAADLYRIREQTRYFGLPDNLRTVYFGGKAASLTSRLLSEPFTLHTAFASVPGRSRTRRVYGFVTTVDGRDLAEELVSQGYARAYGRGRAGPDGAPREEWFARLFELEHSAMLRRAGIWAATDPDRLSAQRMERRREKSDQEEMRSEINNLANPVDINTASSHELRLLPGIGLIRAKRIIANRPYDSVEKLLRVRGIGTNLLERIRDMITVDAAAPCAPF